MRHMRSAERQLRVQALFAAEEFIGLDELCLKLNVSRSSIRRDLIEMENRGLIRRVHGGAISLKTRDEALDFGQLTASCHEEKTRIGRLAATLVKDGQTVILGAGSTVAEVARNLLDRPIQVITNSIPVGQVFWDCKKVEVTLTGGYLYPRIGVQLGDICERMLSGVVADLLIMGVRGISKSGLSDSNTLIVGSIKKMIEVSRKVIIVADHTKFGYESMVGLANLDVIDTVVSDTQLLPEHQKMLQERDVECLLA